MRFIVMATVLFVATPPVAAKELTLEKAVQIAQKKSPFVAAAKHGLDALAQKYQQAKWAWFPKITVRTVGTLIPPQEIKNPKEDDPDLSELNVWSKTDIEVYVPLYTFGKITALQEMALAGRGIGRAAVDLAKREVRYQVTRAWHAIQLSGQLKELIDEGEKELEKARKKLEELEASDSEELDQNDLFRLRIYEAKVLEQVLANRRLMRLSNAGLRVAMGLSANARLQLPQENKLVPVAKTLGSLNDMLALAERHRPELKILRHKVKVQHAEVDRRWAAFFPDFFAAGSFTYAASTVNQQNTVFSSTVFNALGGGAAVGMRLTLDYPKKTAEYREARAMLAKAQAELRAKAGVMNLTIQTAHEEARDSQKVMQAKKRAVKAAKALLTAEVLEYENDLDGTKEFKDVLDASVTFLVTKSEWLRSIYTFNTGVARLRRIVGDDVTRNSKTKGAQ